MLRKKKRHFFFFFFFIIIIIIIKYYYYSVLRPFQDPALSVNCYATTGVIQELMTMDQYLGKYNQVWFYLLFFIVTHVLCIDAENFVLLS